MSTYSLVGHFSNLLNKNSKTFGHENISVPNKLGINFKRERDLKRQCLLTAVKYDNWQHEVEIKLKRIFIVINVNHN